MSIYKRGNVYWYKFMWNGEMIRESTKQGNDRKARNIESAHRAALANGLVGIRERKPAPVLADFLKKDFLSFVQAKHTAKPGTAEYYSDGANMVCKCDFASLPIDKISDQHAQQFAAKYAGLSASRINCGLRSLRRALNLAFEWGKLERTVKITLARGERQRDTVLTDADWQRYIAECPQPWRDAATLIRGTGMRPGEVFALRWENLHLNGTGQGRKANRHLPALRSEAHRPYSIGGGGLRCVHAGTHRGAFFHHNHSTVRSSSSGRD
jgi:integrase